MKAPLTRYGAHTRLVLAVLAVSALSSCGSTVQISAGSTAGGAAGSLDSTTFAGSDGSGALSSGSASFPSSNRANANGAATDLGNTETANGQNPGDGGGADTTKAGQPAPVQIGFLVTEDTGKTTASLGYGGLSTGSGTRQANVAAALLNAHGGLAGHRVIPVIYEATVSGGSGQFQTVCSAFFDDHHVRAVVSLLINDVVRACSGKHGVPYVAGALDSTSAAVIKASPQLVVPNQLTYDQVSVTLVDSLVAQGWFKPKSVTQPVVIGLVTHEESQFSTVPSIVRARLKAAGLLLKDVAYIPFPADSSDIGRASSAGQAAALKFKSDGINRVIGIDEGGFALSWFGVSAGSQNYYPTLALSTTSQPSVLAAGVLTAQQLAGSAGVGWAPYLDTSVQLQAPVSSRTTECLKAMTKAGEDVTGASERTHSIGVCEGTFTLLDAWRAGPLTLAGFQSGLNALGSSYVPVSVFGTDFVRSHAAAAKYRRFLYTADCDCYRYTGSFSPITS